MAKPVILLGAGASIDAGLPNSYDLTQIVYDRLRQRDAESAQLFGFIIAKLLVRNTRTGGTPFAKINIEEAYDTLKRVIRRHDDSLGEFVGSWENIVQLPSRRIGSFEAKDNLKRAFKLEQDHRGRVRLQIDDYRLGRALSQLNDGEKMPHQATDIYLANYINILADVLSPIEYDGEYLDEFVSTILGSVEAVATLNYDELLEKAAKQRGVGVDYGLARWNARRALRFDQRGLKLLKLHGSVNWYKENDDEITFEDKSGVWGGLSRAMIFGGQADKLTPAGPFLSLRHEFQRLLNNSNVFAVVGYSFSDDHLNALIRSWIATKRKAKFVVVDPSGIERAADVFRPFAAYRGPGEYVSDTIEFVEIKRGLRDGMAELRKVLQTAPAPKGKKVESSEAVQLSPYNR